MGKWRNLGGSFRCKPTLSCNFLALSSDMGEGAIIKDQRNSSPGARMLKNSETYRDKLPHVDHGALFAAAVFSSPISYLLHVKEDNHD